MNTGFHLPGSSELMFRQTEFDSLEKIMLKNNSRIDVLKTSAEWSVRQFNPGFVFFCSEEPGKDVSVPYCRQQMKESVNTAFYIGERKKAGITDTIVYIHPSGCVSLLFGLSCTVKGCLFIGPCMTGNKKYPTSLLYKLNPLIRILNKTMLFLEAERLQQEKNRLRYAFSRYVSPDVVQGIVENEFTDIQIGGEKQCLTAIFSDLRGFTSLTENMDATALVRVLNMYLNEMTQVISALGGTIDKFEGDAIVAFFGAPHKLKDHAIRCCLAALRMKKMESILNDQLQRQKLVPTPFYTRIGINTGDMIVGNVGSLQHLDYTIIGSNVNIAARIENANKKYSTEVLISGSTFRQVGDVFECQYIDTAYLKGVHEPVPLYELLNARPGAVPDYGNYEAEHLKRISG